MNIKQLEVDLKFKKFVVRVLLFLFLERFLGKTTDQRVDDLKQMAKDLEDDFNNYRL